MMGDYRITIEATGWHGCSRKTKSGEKVVPCGQGYCPDCAARALVARLGGVTLAKLEHWPVPGAAGTTRTENPGPVDDLLSGVRTGEFEDAKAQAGFGYLGAILAAGLLAMAALVAPAFAEEPKPCDSSKEACAALYTGTTSVITRGDRREFVTARLTASAPLLKGVSSFARADLGGTQDGGSLADPHLFRTVEGVGGLRYSLGKLLVSAIFGATFSIEGLEGHPIDSRLFTLGGLVGAHVGGGYVEVGAGHHGPVGGPALLAAVSIPIKGEASSTIDFAFPFQRNVFAEKTWTLKVGATVRVKTVRLW